jgi:hypothetical protein
VHEGQSYRIVFRLSDKALTTSQNSDGAAVVQDTFGGAGNQLWQFEFVGSGVYRIVNGESGRCLDVEGGSSDNAVAMIQTTCADTEHQYFRLVGTGDGYYVIVNWQNMKVLDVLDFSTADGAAVIQYDCLYAENQQWEIVE